MCYITVNKMKMKHNGDRRLYNCAKWHDEQNENEKKENKMKKKKNEKFGEKRIVFTYQIGKQFKYSQKCVGVYEYCHILHLVQFIELLLEISKNERHICVAFNRNLNSVLSCNECRWNERPSFPNSKFSQFVECFPISQFFNAGTIAVTHTH